MDDQPVLVTGAGIGGLTLACALRRAGVPCRVFEKATELRPIGAGITMQGNAMLAFRAIGLEDAVLAAGEPLKSANVYRSDGRVLTTIELDVVERRVGARSVAFHRGDLHTALLAAAGDVELGATATGYRDADGGVVLVAGDREITGRALVGADGLHSAIRDQVLGATPLRYAGYTSWRGVTGPGQAERLPDGLLGGEALGRGERFGWIPVGRGRVYWFAVARAPEGERDDDPRAAAISRFGGWRAPAGLLIEATAPADVIRTDIHDRAPVKTWGKGRVTLLGDAAHPMTPNLGQGGAQAVEDAVVLAARLARGGDVAAALRDYEAARVKRANRIVVGSRRVGGLFQARGAITSWLRNLIMRIGSGGPATRQAVKLMLDGLVVE